MSASLGPVYSAELDGERLRRQHQRIRSLMLDGKWRTLSEISQTLGYPESSVSAQLRHLRKPQFGSYVINKRRRGMTGLWEYQLENPVVTFDAAGQGSFFDPRPSPMRGH
jgi:hypothetical protein